MLKQLFKQCFAPKDNPMDADANRAELKKETKCFPINMKFGTLYLKGEWKNKVGYIESNNRIIEGSLSLHVNSCAFYLSGNKPSPYSPPAKIHFLINHKIPNPFQLENGIATIRSVEKEYRFVISEEHQQSLQEWINTRLPILEKIHSFPDLFLDSSDFKNNQQHLFITKHCTDNQLLNFLTKNFPIFGQPIPWYDEEIYFTTINDELFFSVAKRGSSDWTWTETTNSIRIVNCLEEYGFFDTSEAEYYFSYKLRYLGESLNKEDQEFVDNEKLNDPLPSLYDHSKSQRFIAEKPFGMTGFFEITWLVK